MKVERRVCDYCSDEIKNLEFTNSYGEYCDDYCLFQGAVARLLSEFTDSAAIKAINEIFDSKNGIVVFSEAFKDQMNRNRTNGEEIAKEIALSDLERELTCE